MKRKRKSPRRHNVKAHTREGYRVNNYIRGKATGISPFISRRKLFKTDEARHYIVLFKYGDGTSEELKTISRSPIEAMTEADELRVSSLRPTEVVVKNQIGRIVKRLGGIALKTLKATAKLGVIAGEKEVEALARYAEDKWAQRLIREAYSRDPAIRVSARAKLRRRYPEYYEIAFERPIPTRRQEIIHKFISEREPDMTEEDYVREAQKLAKIYSTK